MILLQAAIRFGIIFFVLLIIILIVGAPVLTRFIMKLIMGLIGELSGKSDTIVSKRPYYKYPVLYFSCMIVSVSVLTYTFYRLVLLTDFHFI
jgi:hypothetical protein